MKITKFMLLKYRVGYVITDFGYTIIRYTNRMNDLFITQGDI